MNQPPENNEQRVDESVELRLAKLLRRADESGLNQPDRIAELNNERLSPEDLEKLKAAGECLYMLYQFRELSGAADTVPDNETYFEKSADRVAAIVPNSQFGRYIVEHQIGEGGFARVYLARDATLGRKVALKIPRNDFSNSAEARARFQREAKAAASLSHPAIIPVFDSGNIDGTFYIAFALCEGESLASHLKNKTFDYDTTAAVIAKVAEAIEHAHRNDVIHRDLKPANILIDNTNDQLPVADRVRITDFGLALQKEEDRQKLTITGTLVGTPVYMSPEQIKNGNAVGKSTDIYSLGVILHELLLGHAPHKKDNYASTLLAVTTKPVTSLRKSKSDIPIDLEAICLKCLAHDVVDRYTTAYELAADLNRFVDRQPISARKIGAAGHVKRWAIRNPRFATGIAATTTLLIVGIIMIVSMWVNSEANRLAAEQLREKEFEARQIAETRSEELAKQVEILKSIFKNLDPFHEQVDDVSLRNRLGDRLVESADLIVESSDDPSLQISLLDVLSNSLSNLGRPDVAFEIAETAIEIGKSDVATPGDRLRSQIAKAYALHALSKHEESKDVLAEIKQDVLDSEDFKTDEKAMMLMMLAHQWFARAYDENSKDGFGEAIQLFKEMLAYTDNEAPSSEFITIRLIAQFRLAEIAQIAKGNGIERMKSVVDDAESSLGKTHSTTIGFLNQLASSQISSRELDDAKKTAEVAYQRSREKFGPNSGRTLEAMDGLIKACGRSASDPSSKKTLRELLPIAQKICEDMISEKGLGDRKLFTRYGNLATGWGLVGELDKCIEIKQKIVDSATIELGRKNVSTQIQMLGLGCALRMAGQLDEAKEILEEFRDFVDSNPNRESNVWQTRKRAANKELMIIKSLQLFGSKSE